MTAERKRQKKKPHPHPLQWDLALVLSKLVGRPGTGSLPSTIALPLANMQQQY